MRGDRFALRRIAKRSRRADKAQAKLDLKLSKRRRGGAPGGAAVVARARDVCATADLPVSDQPLLRRLLHLARSEFYATDFGVTLDGSAVGLVVAPKDGATLELAAETLQLPALRWQALPLLHTGDGPIVASVAARVFWIGASAAQPLCTPRDVGLSAGQFRQLQDAAARLLGVRLD
jgi:hypothetical protein